MEKGDAPDGNMVNLPMDEKLEGYTHDDNKDNQGGVLEKESVTNKNMDSPTSEKPEIEELNVHNENLKDNMENENPTGSVNLQKVENLEGCTLNAGKEDQEVIVEKEDAAEKNISNSSTAENLEEYTHGIDKEDQHESPTEMKSFNINKEGSPVDPGEGKGTLNHKMDDSRESESEKYEETTRNLEDILGEDEAEPIFDGTEVPGMEANRSTSSHSSDIEHETQANAWPEKAMALKNYVKEKSSVAVSRVWQRLSGKKDEDDNCNSSENEVVSSTEVKEDCQKTAERSTWNPLNYIRFWDVDAEGKGEQREGMADEVVQPITMIGRVLLYTRLGCKDCKEARSFLHKKRLRYVEINIDVYPGRKLELERIAGCNAVPKVFFNEVFIGGLSELKSMEKSGELAEKINYLVTETPSIDAPLPPLSGEDDVSSSGTVDELATVVRKMRESIIVKDRFYKMRRFTNCFVGSEAVDFLSEDQYLEREEAIEYARKLSSQLFFQHILDENVFEDGSHLYRFLDHDPTVSQCYNIPRGMIDVKPKPIIEISSRLRFLSFAIFEAYTSEDGKHVDYRSIHGSEEFARYLRIIEELQRVELQDMPREEKLAFFINLYNMMAIHGILIWGYPIGALERRKLLGEFRYVVGGCTYSLSAIQNGILRGNQRPPYNLMKPFGMKDKRSKVALSYVEPLIHFALVCGNRSGPALRCFSPGNIDEELMDAARNFLRSGGLVLDPQTKVASVSKILKWFSVDFGKNEVEVLKHVANYLEAEEMGTLLELMANNQLTVTYQPYDWGLNC